MYGDIFVQCDDFDEQEICNRLDRDRVRAKMSERDIKIIELLESGTKRTEIAKEVNLTLERVSKIIKHIIKKQKYF